MAEGIISLLEYEDIVEEAILAFNDTSLDNDDEFGDSENEEESRASEMNHHH